MIQILFEQKNIIINAWENCPHFCDSLSRRLLWSLLTTPKGGFLNWYMCPIRTAYKKYLSSNRAPAENLSSYFLIYDITGGEVIQVCQWVDGFKVLLTWWHYFLFTFDDTSSLSFVSNLVFQIDSSHISLLLRLYSCCFCILLQSM